MSLAGRVALITGGAQGIGRAFSEALLQRGAKVCIVDQNETIGKKCFEDLKVKHGVEAITFAKCDVRKTEELDAAFQKTKSVFGRLDILANNAGIGFHADSDVMVDINLRAVIKGTELGLKYMGKDAGGDGGVIINTASMAAFLKAPTSPVYGATKAGVMMYSRCLGNDLHFKRHGVRVNSICPSFTPTALLDQVLADKVGAKMIEMIGTVSIEMVAEGFLQLVEDESKNGAAMRITAQNGIDYKRFPDDGPPMVKNGSKL